MRDTNLIITVPADALAHRGSEQSHYNDVIMRATASQITSLTIVSSTVYSRRRSKKTSKLRVTGLCERNSSVTGEFPTQRASNAENVSIWWRHHEQVTMLTSKYTEMEMSFSRNFYHCSGNCRNDNKLFSLRWYMINFSPDHAIQNGRWNIRKSRGTYWDRDKMDDILQTTFSNAFSSVKKLKCHWSLFLMVKSTIIQHWFR